MKCPCGISSNSLQLHPFPAGIVPANPWDVCLCFKPSGLPCPRSSQGSEPPVCGPVSLTVLVLALRRAPVGAAALGVHGGAAARAGLRAGEGRALSTEPGSPQSPPTAPGAVTGPALPSHHCCDFSTPYLLVFYPSEDTESRAVSQPQPGALGSSGKHKGALIHDDQTILNNKRGVMGRGKRKDYSQALH